MKEQAISKINKLGRISYIIVKIVKILLYIGLVGAIIGEIVLAFLPSDLFKLQIEGATVVEVSKNAILKYIPANSEEEALREFDSYVESGSLKVDGNEYAFADFSVNNDSIIVNGGAKVPAVITISNIRATVAIAIAIIICTIVLLTFISKLCKSLSVCETPFEGNVISPLNRLSFAIIGYAVVKGILSAIISGLMAGATSLNFEIDLSAVLFAIGFYLLTVIFKYGAILQKESDETL